MGSRGTFLTAAITLVSGVILAIVVIRMVMS